MIHAGKVDEARHSAVKGKELIKRNRELGRRKYVTWNESMGGGSNGRLKRKAGQHIDFS